MGTIVIVILAFVKLVVALSALTVLMSYVVAWYERANTEPEIIERRFTFRGICISLWLLLQETGCLLLTFVLRPLGWFPEKYPQPLESSLPPVILLHGLFQNRSCMLWIERYLHMAGFKSTLCINTPPWRDLETLTENLAKKIDELRIRANVQKVILVGHSMGGIIARNYVQNRGGAAYVVGIVTLGTPHHGSKLAPFAISKNGKNLLPNSEFLSKFNSVDWPEETKAISIYSRYDNIVLPAGSAKMTGAEVIELDGMGHNALLFHPRSLEAVSQAVKGIVQ